MLSADDVVAGNRRKRYGNWEGINGRHVLTREGNKQ
jgi:hypothetical protein